MHTKLYATVATLVVYSMTLVFFQQSQALTQRRYERLSRSQPVSGLDLTSFAVDLGATLRDSSRPVLPAPEPEPEPAEVAYDPLVFQTIRDYNEEISREGSERLARQIEGTANMYGVDPYLVTALISQESAFHQSAVSPVGALGLGQLMPETARDLGVNPHDARQNLDGCVRYLAQNLDTWAHTEDPVALALASYNAGPGAVQRYGGIPPYEETQHYVAIIKYRYDLLRQARV